MLPTSSRQTSPPPPPRNPWERLLRAVRNDPKKAGILTVLLAILVVLQVRLQMSRGDASSRATASTSSSDGTSQNRIGSGLGGAAAGRAQDAALALRAWIDAAPTPLGRNLFAINLERFPQDGNRTASAHEGVVGFWDELAKSMSSRADVRKERQILMENLQQQASQMRLQSTMMGATPKAVIDGGLVVEGDVVACGSGESRTTFRVLKIEPRRIIVEREGIKLEIQMK
jgi:hypothetical protein